MSGTRTYDFYLSDSRGKRDLDAKIVLPSVTAIIGATLAKPQLIAWAYQTTIDAVSGLVSAFPDTVTMSDFQDTVGDAVELDAYIRGNKMHHSDVLDEASERGHRAHDLLKTLCSLHVTGKAGPAGALRHAEKMAGPKIQDPFVRSVAGWWISRNPTPIWSERVVYNLTKRYAGRLDGVFDLEILDPLDGDLGVLTRRTLVDLKTRRAGLGMYDSDQLQLGGYWEAIVDSGQAWPDPRRVVLLATDDGEPATETEAWIPTEAFFSLVDLFYLKRRTSLLDGRKIR